MRYHTSLRKLPVLVALVALTLTVAAADPVSLRQRADTEMRASLPAFLTHRFWHPTPFDWSSDGCSNSPDRPAGFNFAPACWRHDFGYRNFLHGLRLDPSAARRAAIDRRLADDLASLCARERSTRRASCRHIAVVYVTAVRLWGR